MLLTLTLNTNLTLKEHIAKKTLNIQVVVRGLFVTVRQLLSLPFTHRV